MQFFREMILEGTDTVVYCQYTKFHAMLRESLIPCTKSEGIAVPRKVVPIDLDERTQTIMTSRARPEIRQVTCICAR